MTDSQTIVTMGGPLFRRPGTSHAEFSTSWHRHAQLVSPWFLSYGIVEYSQIHMPDQPAPPTPGEDETAAREILRRADGVAVVRCVPFKTADGSLKPFGDSGKHPYFAGQIAPDERRFLHVESGATAVKGDPPVFDVPELRADEWRRLALEMGGVEHMKIQDGKAAVDGMWWDEWGKANGGRAGGS